MRKGKLPIYTSPKGLFRYPHLIHPDTKFDKDGRYAVDLILTEDEAPPFIKKLGALHKEAVASAEAAFEDLKPVQKKKLGSIKVNDFMHEHLDEDGDPTGNIVFKFSCRAKGVSRKKGEEREFMRRIAIFDAKGNPIRDDKLQIWSGTIGRVSFVAVPYFIPATGACGISLRPVAAQIIQLVSGGQGKSADEYGFDMEDDGFAYEPPARSPGDEDAEPETDEDNEDEEIDF